MTSKPHMRSSRRSSSSGLQPPLPPSSATARTTASTATTTTVSTHQQPSTQGTQPALGQQAKSNSSNNSKRRRPISARHNTEKTQKDRHHASPHTAQQQQEQHETQQPPAAATAVAAAVNNASNAQIRRPKLTENVHRTRRASLHIQQHHHKEQQLTHHRKSPIKAHTPTGAGAAAVPKRPRRASHQHDIFSFSRAHQLQQQQQALHRHATEQGAGASTAARRRRPATARASSSRTTASHGQGGRSGRSSRRDLQHAPGTQSSHGTTQKHAHGEHLLLIREWQARLDHMKYKYEEKLIQVETDNARLRAELVQSTATHAPSAAAGHTSNVATPSAFDATDKRGHDQTHSRVQEAATPELLALARKTAELRFVRVQELSREVHTLRSALMSQQSLNLANSGEIAEDIEEENKADLKAKLERFAHRVLSLGAELAKEQEQTQALRTSLRKKQACIEDINGKYELLQLQVEEKRLKTDDTRHGGGVCGGDAAARAASGEDEGELAKSAMSGSTKGNVHVRGDFELDHSDEGANDHAPIRIPLQRTVHRSVVPSPSTQKGAATSPSKLARGTSVSVSASSNESHDGNAREDMPEIHSTEEREGEERRRMVMKRALDRAQLELSASRLRMDAMLRENREHVRNEDSYRKRVSGLKREIAIKEQEIEDYEAKRGAQVRIRHRNALLTARIDELVSHRTRLLDVMRKHGFREEADALAALWAQQEAERLQKERDEERKFAERQDRDGTNELSDDETLTTLTASGESVPSSSGGSKLVLHLRAQISWWKERVKEVEEQTKSGIHGILGAKPKTRVVKPDHSNHASAPSRRVITAPVRPPKKEKGTKAIPLTALKADCVSSKAHNVRKGRIPANISRKKESKPTRAATDNARPVPVRSGVSISAVRLIAAPRLKTVKAASPKNQQKGRLRRRRKVDTDTGCVADNSDDESGDKENDSSSSAPSGNDDAESSGAHTRARRHSRRRSVTKAAVGHALVQVMPMEKTYAKKERPKTVAGPAAGEIKHKRKEAPRVRRDDNGVKNAKLELVKESKHARRPGASRTGDVTSRRAQAISAPRLKRRASYTPRPRRPSSVAKVRHRETSVYPKQRRHSVSGASMATLQGSLLELQLENRALKQKLRVALSAIVKSPVGKTVNLVRKLPKVKTTTPRRRLMQPQMQRVQAVHSADDSESSLHSSDSDSSYVDMASYVRGKLAISSQGGVLPVMKRNRRRKKRRHRHGRESDEIENLDSKAYMMIMAMRERHVYAEKVHEEKVKALEGQLETARRDLSAVQLALQAAERRSSESVRKKIGLLRAAYDAVLSRKDLLSEEYNAAKVSLRVMEDNNVELSARLQAAEARLCSMERLRSGQGVELVRNLQEARARVDELQAWKSDRLDQERAMKERFVREWRKQQMDDAGARVSRFIEAWKSKENAMSKREDVLRDRAAQLQAEKALILEAQLVVFRPRPPSTPRPRAARPREQGQLSNALVVSSSSVVPRADHRLRMLSQKLRYTEEVLRRVEHEHYLLLSRSYASNIARLAAQLDSATEELTRIRALQQTAESLSSMRVQKQLAELRTLQVRNVSLQRELRPFLDIVSALND